MKKIFSILAIVAVTVSVASGKILRRQLSIFQASVPETETLALGNMEFVYDYRCIVRLKTMCPATTCSFRSDPTVFPSSQVTRTS